jgi:hypothetical protein
VCVRVGPRFADDLNPLIDGESVSLAFGKLLSFSLFFRSLRFLGLFFVACPCCGSGSRVNTPYDERFKEEEEGEGEVDWVGNGFPLLLIKPNVMRGNKRGGSHLFGFGRAGGDGRGGVISWRDKCSRWTIHTHQQDIDGDEDTHQPIIQPSTRPADRRPRARTHHGAQKSHQQHPTPVQSVCAVGWTVLPPTACFSLYI